MFACLRRQPVVVASIVTFICATALAQAGSQPLQNKLVTVSAAAPFPIGIDYSPTLDKLIVSVNYINGTPHNFETLARDGAFAQFSTVSGLTNEIYLTTVRENTTGGFLKGETYFGMGLALPGEIGKLDPAGTPTTPWLTLPAGFRDLGFRGGIHVDRTGAFGGDLLLIQSNDTFGPARIWRVRSAGGVAMLVDTSGNVFGNQALATPIYTATVHLEGLTTIPNDPKYGPWAGALLTGAEFVTPQPIVAAIRPNGTVADSRVLLDDHGTPIKLEDCEVLSAGYDLYMATYNGTANSKIVSLKAPDLANNGGALGSAVGDVIVAAEFPAGGAPSGNVFQVRWNPNSNAFNVVTFASVSQIEHITTAPALAAIKGVLWCDDNFNGALDSGEGLPGETVKLTGTDFNGNSVNKMTQTLADGAYLFDNLLPGTYSVLAPASSGNCTNISQNPCGHTLDPGETEVCDFEFVPPPGRIHGLLWCDKNGSGSPDPGEGLAGVTVTLTGTDINLAVVNKTTVTAAGGTYSFDDLIPGNYTVTVPPDVEDCSTTTTTCQDMLVSGEDHECNFKYTHTGTGRMTGGGSIFDSAGKRITHGFELHCNINLLPNSLEINWGKNPENNFHLETLTFAFCLLDPNLPAPNPPAAGFNTFVGRGTGKLNGVAGFTIEFTFTDGGEPGTKDHATYLIKDAMGNVVLSASGFLDQGNHQAHAK